MLKKFLIALIAGLATAWAVASHGETRPSLPSSMPLGDLDGPEPITGEPVMPNPGAPSAAPNYFKPYDTGDPKGLWTYEDLSAKEREVVDRGRDIEGWRDIHEGYKAAVLEALPAIKAEAATSHLGAHDLATMGVVP